MFTFKFGKPYICTYCGMPADDMEHTIPYSWFRDSKIGSRRQKESIGYLTPSCKECNNIAGNKIFDTFQKRLLYVNTRLRQIHKKDMGVIWDEEDLSQVEGNLKKYIIAKNKLNLNLRQRIDWISTQDFQQLMTDACDRLYYNKTIDKKFKLFLIDDTYIPSINESDFYCKDYEFL